MPAPAQPRYDLAPYDLGGDTEETIQWGRYLQAVRRYKWLIIALTLVGTAAGAFATRFLKPEYTTYSTIWIETSTQNSSGPIRATELLRSRSWVELLRTGAVMDTVALQLRLYLSVPSSQDSVAFEDLTLAPRYRPGQYVLRVEPGTKRYSLATAQDVPVESGEVGDSIGRAIGLRWAPDPETLSRGRAIAFGIVTPRDAARDIQERLNTSMVDGGNFLRLSLTGKEPKRIATIMNALTDQFVSVAADLKKRQLTILSETLKEQVEYAADNLRDAENRLEGFRIKTITLPSEGVPVAAGLALTQPTVISNYFAQKLELERLKADRRELESLIAPARAGQGNLDAFLSVEAVREAPDLKQSLSQASEAKAKLFALRQRYTDEHPLVKDQLAQIQRLETEVIPDYARTVTENLQAEEQRLNLSIGTASRELEEIPTRSITEQRLDREAKSAANLFQMLQNRYEENKLALASAIPDVKLLDPAVPPVAPSRNTAPFIILTAFAGSIAISILLAIFLDRFDKRFRYPEQVTGQLGLSILGAIPGIRKSRDGSHTPEQASQIIEAFRTVRLNLAHSYGVAGPVMLTVSSPSPGDGKSFVASNLALSFSEAGYETLLMDGDIRRGALHRIFDKDRQPGLLDYLVEEADFDTVVKPTEHQRLSILPCGTRRHLGPELLSSPLMGSLLSEIKSRFKVVIVDSPPLGAGIDPFVLATATGNMLMILRAGETDRHLAEEKLKLMGRLPIRMLGAVLNHISTSESAYRYYNYVYAYTPDDVVMGRLPQTAPSSRTD